MDITTSFPACNQAVMAATATAILDCEGPLLRNTYRKVKEED